jgi:predicted DsbA family dithiol-disulfide isomerase
VADEQLALQLGISGVPAMLLHPEGQAVEEAIEVSGAQSYEVVRNAVEELLRRDEVAGED